MTNHLCKAHETAIHIRKTMGGLAEVLEIWCKRNDGKVTPEQKDVITDDLNELQAEINELRRQVADVPVAVASERRMRLAA